MDSLQDIEKIICTFYLFSFHLFKAKNISNYASKTPRILLYSNIFPPKLEWCSLLKGQFTPKLKVLGGFFRTCTAQQFSLQYNGTIYECNQTAQDYSSTLPEQHWQVIMEVVPRVIQALWVPPPESPSTWHPSSSVQRMYWSRSPLSVGHQITVFHAFRDSLVQTIKKKVTQM